MAYIDRVQKYRQKRDQIDRELKKTGYLRPGKGTSHWRILPPEDDENGDFFAEAQKHFVGKEPVWCRKNWGKACPVCEIVEKLRSEGEQAAAYELAPTSVFVFRAVDRGDESAGPQLAEVKRTVMKDILSYLCDAEYGDITDPISGWDVKIERSGQGRQGTKYSVRTSARPSPLHSSPDKVEEWLDAAPSLDSEVKEPDNSRYFELVDKAGLSDLLSSRTEEEQGQGMEREIAPPPKENPANSASESKPMADSDDIRARLAAMKKKA